jgi:tetratricopeptide (TPR) repeat protein
LGLLLVGYGTLEAWLGNMSYDSPARKKYCEAWLCPEEFWETRMFTLLQQSANGESEHLLPEMQRALIENQGSAFAWADLAEVERDAQQPALAKYCFQRAVTAGPQSAAILFRAANYAFQTGDRDEVLRDLAAVLKDPELTGYYDAAFLTYSRLGAPIDELLDKGMPPLTTAAEPFLQFWMDDNKVPEAKATWAWMLKRSLTNEASCGSYVGFLLRNNEAETATREWRRAYAGKSPNFQFLNWVYNGSFEMEPKPGPFDWHIETTPEVEAARVTEGSHDGIWSVKIKFDGSSDVDYHGVYQEVAIKPGQWRLRAFLKLDGISSDQGISLRVYDPQAPNRLDLRTDARLGTADWSQVERVFTVGTQTKVVQVEVMRGRSYGVQSKIAGQAWVDSVNLIPIH